MSGSEPTKRRRTTIALVSISTLLLAMLGVTFAATSSAATTYNVATEVELRAAITAAASGDTINLIENIVVSSQVTVNKNLTINGNGLQISVPVPGVADNGANSVGASAFRVFRVASASPTFENITIKGGNIQGSGLQVASGATATLRGAVISNGRNAGGGGGGLHNQGTTYLERSSVIRNSASYGGGFLNQGTMYINESSLSENRSESNAGGGGAGEVNGSGVLILNNSTLSNNQSTEIGGALNVYQGKLRVLNTSFTGNVAYGNYGGGAIGNNGGNVAVANSTFAYNFRRTAGNVNNPTAYALDDFGAASTPNTTGAGVSLSYTTYQAPLPAAATAVRGNVQYVETSATPGTTGTNGSTPNVPAYFSGGTSYPINQPTTGAPIGAAVFRPFLIRGSGAFSGVTTPALAVGSWGNLESNRGTTTRYSSTLISGQPVLGYYDRLASTPAWVALTATAPATNVGTDANLVTKDQVGTSRPNGISGGAYTTAGSAQLQVTAVYQVQSVTATGGTVAGASTYGDVYPSGTQITIVAIPDAGKQFSNWIVNGTPCDIAVCPRTYPLTVSENIRIQPVFVTGTSPTITGISPSGGDPVGGTTLTIDGTNFDSGTTVDVGGNACDNVVVVSPTRITCDTPAGSVGVVDIAVTTTAGTDTIPNAFAYVEAPTLSAISPAGGPVGGGTTITLTGTGFIAGTTVTIGGNACTAVNVVSTTELTCLTPGGDLGVQDVVLTTSQGAVTEPGGFTYVGVPTIATVSPDGGPLAGGTSITLSGTGFVAGSTVTVGGAPCTPVVVTSSVELSCTSPSGAEGAVDVVVSTPAGTATADDAFTYSAVPSVTTIAPSGGPTAGGTEITISGDGFLPGTTVDVGGNACTSVVVVSLTEITCTTPAGTSGPQDVVVTSTEGPGTTPGGFLYAGIPTITGISPAGGDVGGGTTVTIDGTDFFEGVTVDLGDNPCGTVVVVSPTQLTCVSTPGAHGLVDVVVTTTEGTATEADGFAYVYAPTITEVGPRGGTIDGGTTITITGTNLYEGTTVNIGGNACLDVVVTPLTSLTCTTPAHAAGLVDFDLTTSEGEVSAANAFTYAAAPEITSVLPAGGPVEGGTTVSIVGDGFFSGMTVTIGDGSCDDVTVVSPTQLTCTTPVGALGAVDVTVTTSVDSGTAADAFTYVSAPTVSGTGPSGGPLAGGTTITVDGAGFVAGMTISVGGIECTNVTVISPTSATCQTPAGPAGPADVVVTTPSGTATDTGGFTYAEAPTISGVSPAGGPPAGETTITIDGDGFFDGVTVTVGGDTCTDVVVISATQLTCKTPPGSAGVKDVVVTTTEGSGTDTGAFTYADAPELTSTSPDTGSTNGGDRITIAGDGFFPGVTVTVGGNACTDVVVVSPTELNCLTPAGSTPGATDVVVTTTEGTDTLADGFTYLVAPTIADIGPAGGPIGGGGNITIDGTNFVTDTTVTVGGNDCTGVVIVSATQLTCTVPAGTEGVAEVVVEVPGGGGSATDPLGYTYAQTPTIDVVLPAGGPTAGGSLVTIEGSGYFDGATVTIDGNPCTNPQITPPGTLTCTAPAGTAGAVDVVVTTSEGSSTSTGGFTYYGVPTFTGISPAGGPLAGGTVITVNGTGFLPGMSVTVGGQDCDAINVASATELTCTTPQSENAGTAAIVLTTLGGEVTTPTAFTYANTPTVESVDPTGGPIGGGNTVTIRGNGFFEGATVDIGGNACTPVVIVSPTVLTCTAPAGTLGVSDVEVTTGLGSSILPEAFRYAPAPTISDVAPTGQEIMPGQLITINGDGFYDGATVVIGGYACTDIIIVSPTQMTCIAPTGPTGSVSLVVSTPAGDATLANALVYSSAAPVSETCPMTVVKPRPAKQKLPVGKTVTLVKRVKTVPSCTLQFQRKVLQKKQARGDVKSKVIFKINKRTGKVTARAIVRGQTAKVRVTAVPVKAPYERPSYVWSRSWTS